MDKLSRNVLTLVSQGAIVANGRLECELAQRLNLSKTNATYRNITGVLDKLERKGHVAVVRHGSVLREVCRVEETVKGDHAPNKEQVAMPASGTEDVAPPQKGDENSDTADDATPLWEQLSLALLALQTSKVNDDGKIASAAPKILAEEADMPLTRAKYLCQKLRDLGFLELSDTGTRRRPIYVVDMEARVTPEVYEEKKTPVSEVENSEDDVAGRGVMLTTAVVGLKTPPKTIAEQLADIVEGLESERDKLLEKVAALTDENGRLRSTIEEERSRFDLAARQAGDVIARLRGALEECSAPPSDRVKDVLNRHGAASS